MLRRWLLALLVIGVMLPGSSGANPSSPRRLALVIGNVDYINHSRLPNVANDVAAVSARLTELGFDVTAPPQRSSSEEFTQLDLLPFAAKLQPGDVVVFYYSGHGFSLGSDNFIVPTGVDATVDQADVQFLFPAESSVRSFLQTRKPAFLLVIMDACRSRPGFVRSGDGQGIDKGEFFPVRPLENITIASATGPGFVASAGAEGARSVFTEALVTHMAEPGQELSGLQRQIYYSMSQAGPQLPFFSESRVTQLWLKMSPQVEAQIKGAWDRARATGLRKKVEEFLAFYATSPYAAEARQWLADNSSAEIGRGSVNVSPLAVEFAWRDAAAADTSAKVASFSGMRLASVQLVSESTTDLATAEALLDENPFAFSTHALAVKNIGQNVVKKGVMFNPRFLFDQNRLPGSVVTIRDLGDAKIEAILQADPAGSGATVVPGAVEEVVARARANGEKLTWVSLATARGTRSVTIPAGIMATQIESELVHAGVPRDQITSVQEVPEEFTGVRIRVFSK